MKRNTISSELNTRFENLGQISEKFRFILQMSEMSKEDFEESARCYAATWRDVSNNLIQEVYSASGPLCVCKTAIEKLNFILQRNLESLFPNLVVALRVFLTMPVTVASAERSFSKLKLIKNYLRSTMDQDRLVHLALISIEHAVARSTPFDEMLEKWASMKTRRVQI